MKILFYIAITFFSISTFCQNNGSITQKDQPLWFVDGEIIEPNLLTAIKTDYIATITVLKGNEAEPVYGKLAKSGAVSIEIKNEFKNEYKKIKKKYDKKKRNNTNQKVKNTTGLVVDCDDIPLANVTISNISTKETILSDFQGKYSIKTHKNDVILFSIKGFNSERVLVNTKSKIDIKLKATYDALDKTGNKSPILIKKPIIYLYPTQKTDVSFTLDFKGKLLTTFPKYNQSWQVTAYPDGKIFDKKTKRFYTSLFWDGENNFPKEHYLYKEGFIIENERLVSFLTQKLEYIGLNTSETNDFIQYWLPLLEKNKLNFIHFWVNDDYNIISKNIVNPKPDTTIRVFMEFYAINKKISLQEQQFQKKERKGFTLVEWGGADVTDVVNKL